MHVEVVTNVVPSVNDSTEELRAMATWIAEGIGADTPWHVTRFFPYLEYADLEPTPLETLRTARAIGQDAGLSFVYLGNIAEPGGEDTVCPECGAVAMRRTGYAITARHTRDGACSSAAPTSTSSSERRPMTNPAEHDHGEENETIEVAEDSGAEHDHAHEDVVPRVLIFFDYA